MNAVGLGVVLSRNQFTVKVFVRTAGELGLLFLLHPAMSNMHDSRMKEAYWIFLM
jgi:hypothetical protein